MGFIEDLVGASRGPRIHDDMHMHAVAVLPSHICCAVIFFARRHRSHECEALLVVVSTNDTIFCDFESLQSGIDFFCAAHSFASARLDKAKNEPENIVLIFYEGYDVPQPCKHIRGRNIFDHLCNEFVIGTSPVV